MYLMFLVLHFLFYNAHSHIHRMNILTPYKLVRVIKTTLSQ